MSFPYFPLRTPTIAGIAIRAAKRGRSDSGSTNHIGNNHASSPNQAGPTIQVNTMSNIRLEIGDLNFCFIVRKVSRIKEEREQSVLIQTDWEYPGTASTFGWSVGCDCSTDGTVDCLHKTASEHMASAYEYLSDNIGKVVEDPGYFDG